VRKFPKWFGSGESSDEYAAAGLELEERGRAARLGRGHVGGVIW
jgi:hypothetical protein